MKRLFSVAGTARCGQRSLDSWPLPSKHAAGRLSTVVDRPHCRGCFVLAGHVFVPKEITTKGLAQIEDCHKIGDGRPRCLLTKETKRSRDCNHTCLPDWMVSQRISRSSVPLQVKTAVVIKMCASGNQNGSSSTKSLMILLSVRCSR